jgi:CelD/BcsL family acetyltransferase involved in cellulose biosynthesis
MITEAEFSGSTADLIRSCGLRYFSFGPMVQPPAGLDPFVTKKYPSFVMDLSSGYPKYLEQRRRHTDVVEATRKMRKLEREHGALSFEWASSSPEVLATMMRWKSEQFRSAHLVDRFRYRWVRELVERLAVTRSPFLTGLLSVMSCDGQPVAIHLNLRSGDRLAGWFAVYDRRFARYSPGTVMLLKLAEHAATEGVEAIDMGYGNEHYKQVLGSFAEEVVAGVVTAGRPAAVAKRVTRKAMHETQAVLFRYPRWRQRFPRRLVALSDRY